VASGWNEVSDPETPPTVHTVRLVVRWASVGPWLYLRSVYTGRSIVPSDVAQRAAHKHELEAKKPQDGAVREHRLPRPSEPTTGREGAAQRYGAQRPLRDPHRVPGRPRCGADSIYTITTHQQLMTTLDLYADARSTLDPDDGEVVTAELVVTDDVLVKAFALGPGAELDAHEHAESTNVFHVLDGEVVVERDGDAETVAAPGVVRHDRGAVHGARNESDDVAVFTASLCPLP